MKSVGCQGVWGKEKSALVEGLPAGYVCWTEVSAQDRARYRRFEGGAREHSGSTEWILAYGGQDDGRGGTSLARWFWLPLRGRGRSGISGKAQEGSLASVRSQRVKDKTIFFHESSLTESDKLPQTTWRPPQGSICAGPRAPFGERRGEGGSLRTLHSISNIKEIRNKHSILQ